MGVELKLVIGEIWNFEADEEQFTTEYWDYLKQYGQSIHEVVTVDLSGVSNSIWCLVETARAEAQARYEQKKVRFTINAENPGGDDRHLVEDRYGQLIGAIKLTDLQPVLKQEFEKSLSDYAGKGYRRYELALAVVDVMLARFNHGEDMPNRLVALTWGH